VSLSLREELRVVLAPQQLLLLRFARVLTRSGLARRVLQQTVVSCTSGSGMLAALRAELSELTGSTAAATVILSNRFMHYALLPWNGALKNAAEEGVVARHHFRRLYGPAADAWELRLNTGRPGDALLASAVDGDLLAALRQVFAETGISLRSIQPGLMAVCNGCRDTLRDCSAWLVLYESGSLCLGLLQQGSWASLRSMRAAPDWQLTLPLLLERESYLIEHDAHTERVLWWAPELEPPVMPAGSRWQLETLQPLPERMLEPACERRFALALGV
jgi:hypothetical protein